MAQSARDSLQNIWNERKLPKDIRAEAYNTLILQNYLGSKIDSAYIMANELKTFTIDNSLDLQYAEALNTLGNIDLMLGNQKEATEYFEESLMLFKTIKNQKGEAIVLNNIGRLYKLNWKLDEALKYYNESLEISTAIADTTSIITSLTNIGNVYNFRFKVDEALKYYEESLKLSNAINDQRSAALTYINIGHNYTMRKEYDKAIDYLNRSINISEEIGNTFLRASAFKNIAQSYYVQKNYDKVIEYSKKCLELAEQIHNKPFQRDCYYFLSEAYSAKKDFESAVAFMEKSKDIEIELTEFDMDKKLQQIQVSKIRTQDSLIQSQKNLEKKLIYESRIQQKTSERNYLVLGFIGFLLALTIVGTLIYRSKKRNQLIAEQKSEIELRKKDKLLKELELQAIDAMILGQEKERKRLASDLHDSVGASLSAAKLQFNYLINQEGNRKDADQLIKKISTLLEDAYVEVRSMAHLKNSGVMATNGLLPAIKKLSDNASASENFQIEFHSHGMEHKLENSLEISIFRIIQELVTNIIKHAEASEAAIHIINHEDSLNIMVEDNGKGFSPNSVTTNHQGMGINSIDKRVEHLNGTMTIESSMNKGTTIIIDIPL